MFTVLVVDDEEWIRKGLLSKIRKSGLPIGDVWQAPSAERALALMSESAVDILICDIRMADMDGLELIRTVRYKYPAVRIVIISGYSEFAYAAEALKHGVVEYLLKPVDSDSLYDALMKCAKSIEQERAQTSRVGELLRLQAAHETRHKINLVLRKDLRPEQIFVTYHPGMQFQAICLFVDAQQDQLNLDVLDGAINQDSLWAFRSNIVYYENHENEIVVVIAIPGRHEVDTYARHVRTLVETMSMELRSVNLHRHTFGVSAARTDIGEAINEAIFCMKHRIFLEDSQVVELGQTVSFQRRYRLPAQTAALLKHNLEAGDIKGVSSTLTNIYTEVMAASLSYRAVQNLYSRLLMIATEDADADIERYLHGLPAEVYQFASLRQVFEAVRNLYITVINSIRPSSRTRQAAVQAVKQYIDEHYAEDLHLDTLAETQGYNASYLRWLFHEVLGMNIHDYVLQVRIEEAKRLILAGNMRMKDVARAAGFSDPHYFSHVFKKVEGVRPTEYLNTQVHSEVLIKSKR